MTDDERREAARRLRAFSEKLGHISIPYLASAIGAEKSDPKSLYDLLADLIEPSGHECVPGECPLNVRHDNDRIDRYALLELADEMDGMRPGYVIARDGARNLAARIREALGATDG